MALEIVSLDGALGAEIRGLNLNEDIDAATRQALRDAWAEHLILVARDQDLSDEDLVNFTSVFGECDRSPPNEAGVKGPGYVPMLPEVAVISNVKENGEPIGSLSNLELVWHTDMSYHELPADGCALYALEVPGTGGETGFLNMYAAFEALQPPLPDTVKDKTAIHDFTYTSAGTLRKGFSEVTDVREAPGARHPMLRTHPVTGRTALFLGRRTNSYVIGLPIKESEELLDRVWAHTTQDQYTYTHKWRAGDVVLWDNRCVMHRRTPFDDQERRVMHRTQMKGAAPYYNAHGSAGAQS